jgi:hypothetical protein
VKIAVSSSKYGRSGRKLKLKIRFVILLYLFPKRPIGPVWLLDRVLEET